MYYFNSIMNNYTIAVTTHLFSVGLNASADSLTITLLPADEKEEIEHLRAYNHKLIANILPEHVAEHFLSLDKAADVSHTLSFLKCSQ